MTEESKYMQAFRKKGHVPVMSDFCKGVNHFVTNYGFHNGPGCVKCGFTDCEHCDFHGESIPECTG